MTRACWNETRLAVATVHPQPSRTKKQQGTDAVCKHSTLGGPARRTQPRSEPCVALI